MGNHVQALTNENFMSVIESATQPVLVDFWAEWCMPCRALAPIIDELAQEYQGKVVVGKVNVDDYKEISAKYGIRGIPTLILFHHGKKVNELVGNHPKEKIKALLASAIAAE